MASEYDGVTHIIQLSSNVGKACEVCMQWLGEGDAAAAANHYLSHAGFRLLHVGSEDHMGPDERPFRSTIVVVGAVR